MRYSRAAQITPENVSRLQPAWQWRYGLTKDPKILARLAQVTPLMIADRCTPLNVVVALTPVPARRSRWWCRR